MSNSKSISLYNIYDPAEGDIVSHSFLVKVEGDSHYIKYCN